MIVATPERDGNNAVTSPVSKMPEVLSKCALSPPEENSRRKRTYLKCMLIPLILKAKKSPSGFHFHPSYLGAVGELETP